MTDPEEKIVWKAEKESIVICGHRNIIVKKTVAIGGNNNPLENIFISNGKVFVTIPYHKKKEFIEALNSL